MKVFCQGNHIIDKDGTNLISFNLLSVQYINLCLLCRLFFMAISLYICPLYLCSLQGKSQTVQDELMRLGEQMVQSAEGTRAIALELCREFEDKFLQHIMTGEVSV